MAEDEVEINITPADREEPEEVPPEAQLVHGWTGMDGTTGSAWLRNWMSAEA